ncbi:MraY family glycosyltransferase [Paenibacillus terrigena]|uniref:glycosyltransferase family 4 protein n=1 Tax=Paenibacillus terrigena TaxID=369333 RepID=UPI0028CFF41A|nr:MraY family glycosyltransferase [Paenibacillus terrigena]
MLLKESGETTSTKFCLILGGSPIRYILTLVISFGIVAALVPFVRHMAIRMKFVDRPTKRKIHDNPIPLMGGIAIYIGFMVTIILMRGFDALALSITIGGTLLVIIGLVDDGFKAHGREFPVWPRLIIYLLTATIPLWFHIQITGIRDFHEGMLMFPSWFVYVSTVVWVFSMTNMMNFIDGVDGLAAGVASISSLTLCVVALIKGDAETAIVTIALCGVCLGFLIYNFYPAKIFMGDAGATFLGYTLAVIAVNGSFKSTAFVTILIPMLALGFPILDTIIVFSRRLKEGKGLHRADKLHTHHALMRWGLTQPQVVSFIYLVTVLFGLLSIVVMLSMP